MNFLGISKPSEAIRAMIEGLKENSDREDFKIDMGSFGKTDESNICFGCAATCTLQKLSGVKFTKENIFRADRRTIAINRHLSEGDIILSKQLFNFESAIDGLRTGCYIDIIYFFELYDQFHEARTKDHELFKSYQSLPTLSTGSWMHNLAPYENFATELEKHGL